MKTINKLIGLLLLLVCMAGCSDSEREESEQQLTPTPATINGTWRLAEWNGWQDSDDWYVYITFDRLEDTYVMYQRVNSMKSEKKTGSFTIEKDPETDSYILDGTYDYTLDDGAWENKYVIISLTDKVMVLTVKGDESDKQTFVRVESVPADIIKGTRAK